VFIAGPADLERTLKVDDYDLSESFGLIGSRLYVMFSYKIRVPFPWLGDPNSFTIFVFVDDGKVTCYGGR
jgi:hypothetical protein